MKIDTSRISSELGKARDADKSIRLWFFITFGMFCLEILILVLAPCIAFIAHRCKRGEYNNEKSAACDSSNDDSGEKLLNGTEECKPCDTPLNVAEADLV